MRIDARIPLRFGLANTLAVQETRLSIGAAGHEAGCACCVARGPAGVALGTLFQQRATGAVPWFTGVLADPADRLAVLDALHHDPVASARFRPNPG